MGSTPYVGEIRCFGFNFAPSGWHFCDGALLPISQFDVLFNLIGTTYGGDGQSTSPCQTCEAVYQSIRGRSPETPAS